MYRTARYFSLLLLMGFATRETIALSGTYRSEVQSNVDQPKKIAVELSSIALERVTDSAETRDTYTVKKVPKKRHPVVSFLSRAYSFFNRFAGVVLIAVAVSVILIVVEAVYAWNIPVVFLIKAALSGEFRH